MSLTYGGMFEGYGGLTSGVQSVFGGRTLWHAEIEPAPCKILAFHQPAVPNLGDVTKVDWASVPKVDVLTGGFPCTDVSHAGKRAGMRPGTRSGLWSHMAYAIDQLRPRLVVIENVRGLLSASAVGDVEPCPWCVGDGEGSLMRALGCVLADLAGLGYDARWYGLRAADVGAPHGRFRVFVFAHPAGQGRTARGTGGGRASDGALRDRDALDSAVAPGDPADVGHERRRGPRRGWDGPADPGQPPADASGDGWDEGWPEPARVIRGPDAAQRSDAPPADTGVQRHGRGQDGGRLGRVDGHDAGETRQRQRAREVPSDRGSEAAADAAGQCGPDEQVSGDETGFDVSTLAWSGCGDSAGDPAEGVHDRRPAAAVVDWGQYAPAIARWAAVMGRPAPAPTEPGPKGGPRLSARFVEWMQGLDEGHVTDVPGISRNDMLKALGNGVVPAQAAEATRMWLADVTSEVAA